MSISKQLLRGDEGVTAVEYGLIAALIAVAIIAAVTGIGIKIRDTFAAIDQAIP